MKPWCLAARNFRLRYRSRATFVNSGWIPALTYSVWVLLLLTLTGGRLGYRSEAME